MAQVKKIINKKRPLEVIFSNSHAQAEPILFILMIILCILVALLQAKLMVNFGIYLKQNVITLHLTIFPIKQSSTDSRHQELK